MRALSKREKFLAIVGGGMFLMTFLFFLLPGISKKIGEMRGPSATAQTDLEEFERLKSRYEKLKQSAQAQGISTGVAPSLVAAMDGLTRQSEIAQDQVLSMIPSSSPPAAELPLEYVEVKLERLTLKQLSNYLVNVEGFRERSIRTDRLQIRKRSDKPELLDAVVRVYSLSPRGG
ncbi:MAG: hypothetical protein HYT87_03130 [Nitrospirae bacterium]|nr:hypothetical protein [Nitrospirota bacterium]